VDGDVARLLVQSELYGPSTRRLLTDAGIGSGMRVLDLGSGTGHVALIAADLEGAAGRVIGVERDARRVALATARAAEAARRNVCFVAADIEDGDLPGEFDAIVGRFVLRELRDAPRTLRRLCLGLAPGGVVAFQEKVLTIPMTALGSAPTLERVTGWLDSARRIAGVERAMGAKLAAVFADAGLPAPELRYEAPIGVGSDWPGVDYILKTLGPVLPLIRLCGIANPTASELAVLDEQLRAELRDVPVTLTPCVGAIATAPPRP
jgi:SAM-dependent methyltransferase